LSGCRIGLHERDAEGAFGVIAGFLIDGFVEPLLVRDFFSRKITAKSGTYIFNSDRPARTAGQLQ